ncbi:uncharacterized protein LOC115178577 [Salmo trutta]|uniref:uncharacterized protein LOC115178577 n=1 Tax=Salmo trutta TaxID=8032 RepID=UPI0011301F4A|nr:uncharacterized protein LOC115178577 [Salmo trutta]
MEIVIGLLLSSLSLYCDFTDAECLVISPARLVVKYGDPASSNCSSDTPVQMGWEATQGGTALTDKKVKFLNWSVDSVTDWNIKTTCFTEGGQCKKQLNITVYKLSDSVSMTGPSGPMVEGKEYEFKCLIQKVAPGNSLNVAFYKASAIGRKTKTLLYAPDVPRQTTKEPISGEYPLLWSPSRGDDGAQLWCSALLGLGELGPQPNPELESEPFNLTVHCESICFSVTRLVMSVCTVLLYSRSLLSWSFCSLGLSRMSCQAAG